MSYVEVGPRRFFEASADVLATAPPPVSSPVTGPAAEPSRPHRVVLRPLPSAVPLRGMAAEIIAFHEPQQPASARYAELLASLLEAGRLRAGGPCTTLLLSAARAEVGATTVLLNLAVTAARQDRRVVVVDANLRRPALAERLSLVPTPGLCEVLSGEVTLADALRPTAQPGLSLLAAGAPAALLTDETSLRDLVRGLEADFDLVLIDGPRVEGAVPAAGRAWEGRAVSLLAALCQAMFVVVPAGEADTTETAALAAGLAARALPLAGCIVAG